MKLAASAASSSGTSADPASASNVLVVANDYRQFPLVHQLPEVQVEARCYRGIIEQSGHVPVMLENCTLQQFARYGLANSFG